MNTDEFTLRPRLECMTLENSARLIHSDIGNLGSFDEDEVTTHVISLHLQYRQAAL